MRLKNKYFSPSKYTDGNIMSSWVYYNIMYLLCTGKHNGICSKTRFDLNRSLTVTDKCVCMLKKLDMALPLPGNAHLSINRCAKNIRDNAKL